jgi:ATP-binding cassette subfamily B protein
VTIASASLLLLGQGLRGWIDGLHGGRSAAWGTTAAGFVAMALVFAVCSGLRIYASTLLGEAVGAKLRTAVFANIIARPLGYFESSAPGDILSLIISDVTVVQLVLRTALSPLLRNLLTLAGAGVMMGLTSWRLTALCLLALPAPAVMVLGLSRTRRTLVGEVYDRIGRLSATMAEVLAGMATVKTLNREPIERERFDEQVAGTAEIAVRLAGRRSFLLSVVSFVGILILGLILWVAGTSVRSGGMTVGAASAFLFFILLAAGSCASLGDLWSDASQARAALRRIARRLADDARGAEPEVFTPAEPRARPGPMGIRFEDVCFRYPSRSETLALDQVSMDIAPGETVAFVGASGAGKSTIARLLLGFDLPESGRILIDGAPTSATPPARIRDWFAVVQQDPFIFSASLAENIRYGRPEATDREVEAAAEAAAVNLFARELPEGMDTFLGERGARLSGGQRQRVAIARAILRQAPILLLDEATSALDPVTEERVCQAILRPASPRTTLVIAHGLSTVRMAQRIVVMHRGRVEAIGEHDRLMSDCALYRHLAGLRLGR